MEAASIGTEVVNLVKLAAKEGWLDKLRNLFKKKHRVLVLGSTGVGKTVFLKSLTEVLPEAISSLNRTEFAERHAIQIEKQPFIFVDTPGQLFHASRRTTAIREELTRGISGVCFPSAKVGHIRVES